MTRLRELRIERGLRILDVTCALRIHPSTLSSVECGRLAVPAQAKGVLSSFFGVDEGELFGENGIAV